MPRCLVLKRRKLGPFSVSSIGLGCMNLSHAYGVPPSPDAAAQILRDALDLGVTHFDNRDAVWLRRE